MKVAKKELKNYYDKKGGKMMKNAFRIFKNDIKNV